MTEEAPSTTQETVDALFYHYKNGDIDEGILYKTIVELAAQEACNDDLDSVVDLILYTPRSYWDNTFLTQALDDEVFLARASRVSEFLLDNGYIPIEALGNTFGTTPKS